MSKANARIPGIIPLPVDLGINVRAPAADFYAVVAEFGPVLPAAIQKQCITIAKFVAQADIEPKIFLLALSRSESPWIWLVR